MKVWKYLRTAYLIFLFLFAGIAALALYPIYEYLRKPITHSETPSMPETPSASPTAGRWTDVVERMDPKSLLGVSPTMIPKFEEMVDRVAPRSAQAQVGLGILYQYKGLNDKAVERYKKAVEIDPALPDAHYRLGTAYQAQGHSAAAETEYRETLRVKTDYWYAYFSLAGLCQEQGRSDEAATLYKKILEGNPRDYQAHNNLAIVYEDKGMFQEAMTEYVIASQLNPNDPVVQENVRRAKAELPDEDRARGASLQPQEVKKEMPAPAKRQLFKPKALSHIYLKNKQTLDGEIAEKDGAGLWFQIDSGTRVYIFNEEIEKVVTE